MILEFRSMSEAPAEMRPSAAPAASCAPDEDCATPLGHAEESQRGAPARRLMIALPVTAGFMVVEAIAGWLFGSLALLSDALHMLTDTSVLALALVAQRIATRPRSARQTYGYRRAETLAAFVSGLALGVSAIFIVVEAIGRWREPTEVLGEGMLLVAIAGLLVNLICAKVLSHGHEGHNVNTRAALYHVLADALGSVGAIVAAILVLAFDWYRADSAVSVLLAAFLIFGAWRLVSNTGRVLMEGAPHHLDGDAVERTIAATPGVADVHDFHLWTIAEGFPVVTVHVVLDGERDACDVSRSVCDRVAEEHGISHVTVQPESAD